jgi:hypothetical protein
MNIFRLLPLLLISILILSCGEKKTPKDELMKEDHNGKTVYKIYINVPENNGADVIEFSIPTNIVDSLGVDEKTLIDIAKTSINSVKSKAKHPLTFEYSSSALIYFSETDNELICSTKGSGQNALGVPGMITSSCIFDLKGDLKSCL